MSEEKICPVCGESFKVPTTRPKQIYCSRDCAVIGRRLTKEDTASKRVDTFIDTIPDIQIHDVLEGRLKMDHRMTVPGAGMWKDKKFIVLVVD